jgi:CubicO group peptidase (beta-lactamase class C family)
LACSSFVVTAHGQSSLTVNDISADLRTKIDATAQQALDQTGVPSASVAIVQGGKIVYTQAYGKAKLDPPIPAEPSMRYSVGSISNSSRRRRFCCSSSRGSCRLMILCRNTFQT